MGTGFWGSKISIRRSSTIELSPGDALVFWQKEVHYYETRAGDQGASAHRIITIAAGATALVPLVGTAMRAPIVINDIDIRLFLYLAPAVVLLLWATVIRLLHEMSLLREYRYHAELQVLRIAEADSRLQPYRPWEGLGTVHDTPQPVTAVLTGLAGSISVVGIIGVVGGLYPLVEATYGWWWAVGSVVIPAAIIALLSWAFIRNGADAARLARDLGNPKLNNRLGDPAD